MNTIIQNTWKISIFKWLIWFAGALIALSLLLPTFYLVIRALDAGNSIWGILFSARTMRVLLRTIYLATSVTLGSALLAVPIAWLTVRSDLPMRRFWAILTTLP